MTEHARIAVAIRHVPFEDLGTFEGVLAERGYAIAYREAGVDDLAAINPVGPDLLVVLGGPIGAYEEAAYPFVLGEGRLLERRRAADRPTLGICLGAQMMARALGGRVFPGGRKEIGWSPLRLTEAGRASCLRFLAPEETAVLHWHGDTFDLPAGAQRLASTDLYENQAFSWGRNGLDLQFHGEVTDRRLERWVIRHACEIAGAPSVTPAQLRRDTAGWAPALETQGRTCLDAWLRDLSPSR